MPTTITIRDESTSGKTLNEFSLELLDERMTVRDLIRSRVYQEVKDFHRRPAQRQTGFPGLIQPNPTEVALNGDRRQPEKRKVDWQRQFERAIAAFRAHQILILVDDRQAETLDEEIHLTPTTRISFLRLTLLTGG